MFTAQLTIAAHGRVFQTPNGKYAAILSGNDGDLNAGPGGIFELTSSDGLTFSHPKLLLPVYHDPLVIKYNGIYLLYADNDLKDSVSQALLTASKDGLNWNCGEGTAKFLDKDGSTLAFGAGVQYIGDTSGIVKSDGSLELFTNYKGQDLAYYSLKSSGPFSQLSCLQ